jgi:hypothetical protein
MSDAAENKVRGNSPQQVKTAALLKEDIGRLVGMTIPNDMERGAVEQIECLAEAYNVIEQLHQGIVLPIGAPCESSEDFYCPILGEIMDDPVITCDGFTYERTAIVEWLSRSDRSPCTNLVLASKDLIPNTVLKTRIEKALSAPRL